MFKVKITREFLDLVPAVFFVFRYPRAVQLFDTVILDDRTQSPDMIGMGMG
jgi:hypothetical protein